MKILGFFFIFVFTLAFAKSANSIYLQKIKQTQIQVVELSNYSFAADSFFEERRNLNFIEKPAETKFYKWAFESIDKVNQLIPKVDRLEKVKIKLIFHADIQTTHGLMIDVPMSIIDSYQEPKTLSIRLGMLELKDDEISFRSTVAHEYAHLVFENASRKARTTLSGAEVMLFWSKPIYEGAADVIASMALNTHYTGSKESWGTRDLFEFKTLEAAQLAKDTTVSRARNVFQKMDLVPKYEIYENWLKTVEKFIQASGGKDPYAEGSWFAGSLLKVTDTHQKKLKLAEELLFLAKSGLTKNNSLHLYEELKSRIQK